jgi:preprotein translocase subunit YajC
MKNKFKVGDRVENSKGCKGTIIEIDSSTIPYRVQLDLGNSQWEIEHRLKLIPSTINQRIEQLEKELADLKESVRPKKKIEFVKWLNNNSEFEYPLCAPREYESVELLYSYNNYDIMLAKKTGMEDSIYLGHFNDGIK